MVRSVVHALCAIVLLLPVRVAMADKVDYIEDRLNILNTVQSITPFLDEERLAGWAEIFDRDIKMIALGAKAGRMEIRGLAALQTFFRHRYDAQYRPMGMRRRHAMSTIRVYDQSADAAHVQSYVWIAVTKLQASPTIENVGVYDIELRKEAGAWRIVEWVIKYDASVGEPVEIPDEIRGNVTIDPLPQRGGEQ